VRPLVPVMETKLVNERDNRISNLTNTQDKSFKPGARVEVLGTKIKDPFGDRTFEYAK
jgi:hypothetical protein